ncbi:MAG: TfoX/Sxy family protein [Solirubrobacteraceae bacterium]
MRVRGNLAETMPYDEDLALRIRALLAEEDAAISEKKMFGGLAFLLRGHMAVAAARDGGLLVRVRPEETEAHLARPHVALMQMGGRSMQGWITVAPAGLKDDFELKAWVDRGADFARSLPPK